MAAVKRKKTVRKKSPVGLSRMKAMQRQIDDLIKQRDIEKARADSMQESNGELMRKYRQLESEFDRVRLNLGRVNHQCDVAERALRRGSQIFQGENTGDLDRAALAFRFGQDVLEYWRFRNTQPVDAKKRRQVRHRRHAI